MDQKFLGLIFSYNEKLISERAVFRLKIGDDGFIRECFNIVLENEKGLDSYILNLSNDTISDIISYFKTHGYTLSSNNVRDTFWVNGKE